MTRALVIGGGHNGLVSGVVLARAGLDVTVLESADEPGGCLWSQEVDGVRLERGAIDHGGFADVAADLGLDAFGLDYVRRERLLSVAFGDGQAREFEVSTDATARGLGADGDSYRELVGQAQAFFAVLDQFPVPPTPTQLAATLSHLKGGDATFRSLLGSADAVIGAAVADPHTRAALALYAAHGQIPPWCGGSGMLAYLLPSSHDGAAVRPVGGSRAVVGALVGALEAAGGVVRSGARVTGISASSGGGFVVELADGERLTADRVVSSLDVRRVVGLLDRVPAAMQRSADAVASGRLNVAELTVGLVGGEALLPERLRDPLGPITFVQSDLGDVRRGFGDVIAGRLPGTPWAMAARADDARGDGVGVWLSSVVPLRPADGPWTPEREAAAADRVVETVSAVLGHDLALARARVVSGPLTWGARLASDGNPNHIDLTLDQMLGWRPPGLAGHRTPVPGLYLAGAGTHPGGGLSGASGRAAATTLLKDLGVRRRGARPGAAVAREVAGLWKGLGAYLAMRKAGDTVGAGR